MKAGKTRRRTNFLARYGFFAIPRFFWICVCAGITAFVGFAENTQVYNNSLVFNSDFRPPLRLALLRFSAGASRE
jgi:hypothetical protein